MTDEGSEAQDHESQFRRVYEENLKTIYGYVGARVQNRSDVPDLVAEVFATAWRRIGQMPVGQESRAWLVGVARRTLWHHYRAELRRGRLRDRIAAEPAASPGENPAAVRLEWAFSRLASKDQEVLRMVTWDELSNEEAAEVLGCSKNALAIRIHRARRQLARQMQQTHIEGADSHVPTTRIADERH